MQCLEPQNINISEMYKKLYVGMQVQNINNDDKLDFEVGGLKTSHSDWRRLDFSNLY